MGGETAATAQQQQLLRLLQLSSEPRSLSPSLAPRPRLPRWLGKEIRYSSTAGRKKVGRKRRRRRRLCKRRMAEMVERERRKERRLSVCPPRSFSEILYAHSSCPPLLSASIGVHIWIWLHEGRPSWARFPSASGGPRPPLEIE